MKALVFLAAFPVLLVSVGCGNDVQHSKKQAHSVSDSTWVQLLGELYLAEALKNKRSAGNQDITAQVRYIDSTIIARHNLTLAEFDAAYMQLAADFKRIDKIYERVLERLSKKEEEIKSDTLKVYNFFEDFR